MAKSPSAIESEFAENAYATTLPLSTRLAALVTTAIGAYATYELARQSGYGGAELALTVTNYMSCTLFAVMGVLRQFDEAKIHAHVLKSHEAIMCLTLGAGAFGMLLDKSLYGTPLSEEYSGIIALAGMGGLAGAFFTFKELGLRNFARAWTGRKVKLPENKL